MIGVPADVFVDGTADPGVMDGVCVGLVAELVEDPDDDDADDGEPIEPVVARASLTTSVAVEPTMAARLTIRVTSRARLAGCRRVRLIGLALRSTLIRTSSSAVSNVERGPEGFLDEDCEPPVSRGVRLLGPVAGAWWIFEQWYDTGTARSGGRAGFEPATRGLKAPCSNLAELPALCTW